MSVLEKNTIDGIGISEDGKTIVLLLSDHLSWESEYEHLIQLQEKINGYIEFWESKQYKAIYKKSFKHAVIEIHFKYRITDKCMQFLTVVSGQLRELRMEIKITEE